MLPFRVAIPSYQRSATLRSKTLAYLAGANVPNEAIDIFCADAAEMATYGAALGGQGYTLVQAAVGMRAVRNFIDTYYPVGTRVLCLDDDLTGLYRKVDDKRLALVDDLPAVARTGFDALAATGAHLWGIGAVLNALFMKHEVSFNLKYCVGCAWGFVSHHNVALAVTLDDKEDFERTMLYYLHDGLVVRLNNIAPKTRYYKEPGGMQVERTRARVDWSARKLAAKYPYLCTLKQKPGGPLELRLRDTRPTQPQRPRTPA